MPYKFNPFTGNLDIEGPIITGTGTVSAAADGTAQVPGINFASDLNTGIYRPGADQLAISTNGTGRLFVDANGNVGIGASSITNLANYAQLALEDANGGFIDFLDDGVNQARIIGSGNELTLRASNTGGSISFDTDGNTERLRITASGQLSFIGAGTSGSPAVGFNGSAPSNSLVIDSTGRLGIGTSSPASTLDVAGNISVSSSVDAGSGSVGLASLIAAQDLVETGSSFNLTGGALTIRSGFVNKTTNDGYGSTRSFVGGNLTLAAGKGESQDASATKTNGSILFGHQSGTTGFDPRMTIDGLGNVGIGTTQVDTKLVVAGDNNGSTNNNTLRFVDLDTSSSGTQESGRIEFYTSDTTQSGVHSYIAGQTLDTNGNGGLTFGTGLAGSATEAARIDSSGRLLVGTSSARSINSATHKFQVEDASGSGSGRIAIGTNNNVNATGPGIYLFRSRGGALGSNTIVQDGDDLGSIYFQGADGTDLDARAAHIRCEVDGTPGSSDMPGRLVFSVTESGDNSPTSRLVLRENGDVLIPAASATKGLWIGTGDANGKFGNANFRIGQNSTGVGSGTLYIGNAAIQVSSDRRLKQNIQDTALSAVESLQKVRVVDFTWNDPSDTSYNNRNARGTWTGVIAQELVEVFPFAVNAPRKEDDLSLDHDSDSTWSVEQQQLVPVLIKAIQEQQVVIADLQNRLAALEAQ